jgi:demethylmenaquinone methyltransferase/2-methoxy-6-polyprenyl-1,4-benzoquinol methylase
MRPYTYLPASLVKFPEREAVVDMFRRVGLDRVRYHGLTGGVVTLHVGVKPG